jgi:hypothetical protein
MFRNVYYLWGFLNNIIRFSLILGKTPTNSSGEARGAKDGGKI